MQTAAPNAALLIDFDNVTMGMRSDLSKELKSLLQSDIIRGKVTVQRAYADWRRYPQYIVPLSEASIDLIFAPAYGSNKKNATDIRMAIDGMELVFTRPEIGTYILLTGDSDFSSLVLKLKEYGKYVIGVGIQESSSDILVQNCDEYYSYTNLSGLRKTTDSDVGPVDPWVLVEQAVQRMAERNDVMRSDRLKQVMLEIDPGFDEGSFGFSKFSRFVTEASSKGLLHLKKMDNGQYEVEPAGGKRGGGGGRSETPSREREERGGRGGRNGGRGRDRDRDRGGRGGREEPSRQEAPRAEAPRAEQPAAEAPAARRGGAREGDPLQHAYDLLSKAVERLVEGRDAEAVRDSDVKRKMLEMESGFDEAELGFTKFSRFLRQAHDHEVITLRKRETGNYEVALPSASEKAERASKRAAEAAGGAASAPGSAAGGTRAEPEEAPPVLEGQGVPAGEVEVPSPQGRSAGGAGAKREAEPEEPETLLGALGRRLGLRIGSSRRREDAEQPSLLEGQAVEPPKSGGTGAGGGTSTPSQEAQRDRAPRDRERQQRDRAERDREQAQRERNRLDDSRREQAQHAQAQREQAERALREEAERGAEEARTAREAAAAQAAAGPAAMDPSALGLPTDADAQVRYLANSYKGVGTKTAESLVEGFGEDLFTVLQEHPDRVKDVIPPARAEAVLDQWKVDFARRRSRMEEEQGGQGGGEPSGGGTQGGDAGRGRGRRGSGSGGRGASAETTGERTGGGRGRQEPSPGQTSAGRREPSTDAPSGGRPEQRGRDDADRGATSGGAAGGATSGDAASGGAGTAPASSAPEARPDVGAAAAAEKASGSGAGETPSGSPEERPKSSSGGTRTVAGIEIPEDAEPSPLRGRRSGRRGR